MAALIIEQPFYTLRLFFHPTFLKTVIMLRKCSFLLSFISLLAVLYPCLLEAQDLRSSKESLLKSYADKKVDSIAFRPGYYLLATTGNKNVGILPTRNLSDNLDVILIETENQYQQLKSKFALVAANDEWKLSESLRQKNISRIQLIKYQILCTDAQKVFEYLENLKPAIVVSRNIRHIDLLNVYCSLNFLKDNILPLTEVYFIDEIIMARPEISAIGYERNFHGINAVDHFIQGANGRGITIGIKENSPDPADLDIIQRILPSTLASSTVQSHATTIASLAAGAGNIFYDGRGIANHALIFPSSFSNLMADDPSALLAKQVSIQNHSYGTVIQNFYGIEAQSYDQLSYSNKNYVAVFSSGNSGKLTSAAGLYAGIPAVANLTGNFKMAKNVITVGAVNNEETLVAESSQGPAYDGRIVPQLIALGANGTSDAAAIVSGTIAVMQQVYADSNVTLLPSAALVKATLYNTAADIGLPGLDHKSGYGSLASYAAIKSLQERKYEEASISIGNTYNKQIFIPANANRLKVTLSWTDSAASVNNNRALLNDLDLQITHLPTGQIFLPWVLSSYPHPDSLKAPAKRRRDSLNTSEKISIDLPLVGLYTITVTASKIYQNNISFAIAFQVDTSGSFIFTNPVTASDVDRKEKEYIPVRWETAVADTNSAGKLSISYNDGQSWQVVENSIQLSKQKYIWKIPALNTTAQFKMETTFGSFLSPAFMIENITVIKTDFVCTDSIRLSWPKYLSATSYNIYAYADSAFLKKIISTPDSFLVMQKNLFPYNVFAVQPVLSNGLIAPRSVALDIRFSGIKCFYENFTVEEKSNNNIDLEVHLSIRGYVDSVIFERTDKFGKLLGTISRLKTSPQGLNYSASDLQLQSGTYYYRVRLLLRSGDSLQTAIEEITVAGTNLVVFSPTPGVRGQKIKLIVQPGADFQSSLLLYNAEGKMLQIYKSLPEFLPTESFAAGVVFYKILSRSGSLLQSGKIIILPM